MIIKIIKEPSKKDDDARENKNEDTVEINNKNTRVTFYKKRRYATASESNYAYYVIKNVDNNVDNTAYFAAKSVGDGIDENVWEDVIATKEDENSLTAHALNLDSMLITNDEIEVIFYHDCEE